MLKTVSSGFPTASPDLPAGQILSDHVQKRHLPHRIGDDDAVANARQRRPQQFSLLVKCGG